MSWFGAWFSGPSTEQQQKTDFGGLAGSSKPEPLDPSHDQHQHHHHHPFWSDHPNTHHYGRRSCPKGRRDHSEEEHPFQGPHGAYMGPFGPHGHPGGYGGHLQKHPRYPQGDCGRHRHHEWSRFGGHNHRKGNSHGHCAFPGHHGWQGHFGTHRHHEQFVDPDARGSFLWQ